MLLFPETVIKAAVDTLKEVAARTGGKYYRATSEEKLESIYREIGELEATDIKSEIHVDYSERFAYFLWGLVRIYGCHCNRFTSNLDDIFW